MNDCAMSKEALIHPTAMVAQGAVLGDGVRIGPYSVVGPHVRLGDGAVLHSHVTIQGHTTLGEACEVFPFASLGHAPQDKKYQGEPSEVHIGARVIMREYVTIQPGTQGGGMRTSVGDDCLLMASTHVAHDCHVGHRVIMANNATLGGHVTVGDDVVLGGLCAIHQFVRIGASAMIAGMTGVSRDVIPYGMVGPRHNTLSGLNLVGLRRLRKATEEIQSLRMAYAHLFENMDGTLDSRLEDMPKELAANPLVKKVHAFLKENAKRPLCLPAEV